MDLNLRPSTELDDWFIFQGRIEGQLKTGKRIITSKIVERHEDTVITKTRNPYKLLTPIEGLDRKTLLKSLDDVIKENLASSS